MLLGLPEPARRTHLPWRTFRLRTMALRLTLLCAFWLSAFALAVLPQCAISCLSPVRPEFSISADTDATLLCSSDLSEVFVCADNACTPDELHQMGETLRILCTLGQAERAPPEQNVLPSIEAADEVSRAVLDTAKVELRFTRRDDDDDDNDDDNDDDDDGDSDSSRHSNIGGAVGGTLGGVAAVAALVGLYIHHRRRRQRRRRQPKKQRHSEIDPEDPNSQFRPPQVFQPSSGDYDPHAQSASATQSPPLAPAKDASAGAVAELEGPPAYGSSDQKRSGPTILQADT